MDLPSFLLIWLIMEINFISKRDIIQTTVRQNE